MAAVTRLPVLVDYAGAESTADQAVRRLQMFQSSDHLDWRMIFQAYSPEAHCRTTAHCEAVQVEGATGLGSKAYARELV